MSLSQNGYLLRNLVLAHGSPPPTADTGNQTSYFTQQSLSSTSKVARLREDGKYGMLSSPADPDEILSAGSKYPAPPRNFPPGPARPNNSAPLIEVPRIRPEKFGDSSYSASGRSEPTRIEAAALVPRTEAPVRSDIPLPLPLMETSHTYEERPPRHPVYTEPTRPSHQTYAEKNPSPAQSTNGAYSRHDHQTDSATLGEQSSVKSEAHSVPHPMHRGLSYPRNPVFAKGEAPPARLTNPESVLSATPLVNGRPKTSRFSANLVGVYPWLDKLPFHKDPEVWREYVEEQKKQKKAEGKAKTKRPKTSKFSDNILQVYPWLDKLPFYKDPNYVKGSYKHTAAEEDEFKPRSAHNRYPEDDIGRPAEKRMKDDDILENGTAERSMTNPYMAGNGRMRNEVRNDQFRDTGPTEGMDRRNYLNEPPRMGPDAAHAMTTAGYSSRPAISTTGSPQLPLLNLGTINEPNLVYSKPVTTNRTEPNDVHAINTVGYNSRPATLATDSPRLPSLNLGTTNEGNHVDNEPGPKYPAMRGALEPTLYDNGKLEPPTNPGSFIVPGPSSNYEDHQPSLFRLPHQVETRQPFSNEEEPSRFTFQPSHRADPGQGFSDQDQLSNSGFQLIYPADITRQGFSNADESASFGNGTAHHMDTSQGLSNEDEITSFGNRPPRHADARQGFSDEDEITSFGNRPPRQVNIRQGFSDEDKISSFGNLPPRQANPRQGISDEDEITSFGNRPPRQMNTRQEFSNGVDQSPVGEAFRDPTSSAPVDMEPLALTQTKTRDFATDRGESRPPVQEQQKPNTVKRRMSDRALARLKKAFIPPYPGDVQ